MQDSASHLHSVLRSTVLDQEAESDFGLPTLTDGQYQPYSRAASKPQYALHVINSKGEVQSFQYVHLDSNTRYTAERIELCFMGLQPVNVTIHGRNLWRLYDYIHQHRISWVLIASQDFTKDGQPVITRVAVEKVRQLD